MKLQKNKSNNIRATRRLKRRATRRYSEVVCSTMGAGGKIVASVTEKGTMSLTKDGAGVGRTYATGIKSEDLISSIISDAAANAARKSGDGTTLCTLMASELVQKLNPLFRFGDRNLGIVKQGMMEALENVVSGIESRKAADLSEDLLREMIRGLVKTSLNHDMSVLDEVTEAAIAAGEYGYVNIKAGAETEIDIEKGYPIDNASVAAQYIQSIPEAGKEIKNAGIVVIDGTFTSDSSMVALISAWRLYCREGSNRSRKVKLESKEGVRPLILIGNGISGEALMTFIKNASQFNKGQGFENYIMGVSSFNVNEMADLKTVLGVEKFIGTADAFDVKKDLNTKTASQIFGEAASVKIKRDRLIISPTEENQSVADELLTSLKKSYISSPSESVRQRIGKLSSSYCVLSIASQTVSGSEELFYRVEDAITSAQSSYKGGFCCGGGVPLLKARAFEMETEGGSTDFNFGWRTLHSVLDKQFFKIAENAGLSKAALSAADEIIFNDDLPSDTYFDVRTNSLRSATSDTLVDSTYVIRVALESAVEAAINITRISFLLNVSK